MIVDTLQNLRKYVSLNPLIGVVAEFIETHDLGTLSVGHHDIQGEEAGVNVQRRPGKRLDEAVLEFHRQMVDIQVPLNETETYGYLPVSSLPPCDFNVADDIGFAKESKPLCYVTCRPGMFALFTPDDAHAPLISDAKELNKLIFKIKA